MKPAKQVRCCVYTRKSVEEGLQQEFNSLHAQREACEAYIKSQTHNGLVCLPEHFDDGGYSGGNLERPELKRLLDMVVAGQVDCVVIYKLDRLSRSIHDFFKLMELFEKHNVTFISITQSFDTNTSMGRLMLNILLSFGQYERELVSERTRDKICATRKKGRWTGGQPILGFDVDPGTTRLAINHDEARRVRAIFQLYAEKQALRPVVEELAKRGWCNKSWTTKRGIIKGGQPFSKTNLHLLLTNCLYIGQVRYKTETFPGEQEAIIDEVMWQRVQKILQQNNQCGGAEVKNKSNSLLKGLLHCVPCGTRMTPAHSKKGNNRYRYYCCTTAQKKGWKHCPSKSIPAAEIERFVVDQIRQIGTDPELVQDVIAQVTHQQGHRLEELHSERKLLEKELGRWKQEMKNLVGQIKADDPEGVASLRLAEVSQRFRQETQRLKAIDQEAEVLRARVIEEEQVISALADFDNLWAAMNHMEQTRLLRLLIEKIEYDGKAGQVSITFHATGLQTFLAQPKEVA